MPEQVVSNADFTRHWVRAQPLVTSFIFSSVRSSHDAEDVLQEVASAALVDFDQFDQARPFLPWVMGIARFRVLNYYRRHASEKLQFSGEALEAFARAHELMEHEVSERRHALDECLQRVEGRKKDALRMRYCDGLSVGQIAAALSTTANAVSILLHKVRRQLAECVDHRMRQGGAG